MVLSPRDCLTEINNPGQPLVETLAKLLQGEFGSCICLAGGLKKECAEEWTARTTDL